MVERAKGDKLENGIDLYNKMNEKLCRAIDSVAGAGEVIIVDRYSLRDILTPLWVKYILLYLLWRDNFAAARNFAEGDGRF